MKAAGGARRCGLLGGKTVSSTSVSGGTSTSRKPLVIILAVIGVLAIIVGVLYMVAGTSLPSFLTAGSHVHKGNHLARGGVALVLGVACLIGAWFSSKTKSSS
jgi:threonine/homoserine/homoserine lactone efflux protein